MAAFYTSVGASGLSQIALELLNSTFVLRNRCYSSPLGPSVTPTASASLLIPFCILRLDSLSKTMSFDTACTCMPSMICAVEAFQAQLADAVQS